MLSLMHTWQLWYYVVTLAVMMIWKLPSVVCLVQPGTCRHICPLSARAQGMFDQHLLEQDDEKESNEHCYQ